MRCSHWARVCELCSMNNGKKLGTAVSGIVKPKSTNRHPFPVPLHLPMNEAITPQSWVDIQPNCSTVLPHQAGLWPHFSWLHGPVTAGNLGSWQRRSQRGCGTKLRVWVSKNCSNVLGKKILAQNQTDFRKDCSTDPASPCLDLNVILQMIIYLDFCSFFLLVLFTLKEGLLSNN